ncbi:MAG: nicotinate-nucleotide--dimethylbenzimidazole phosphoribosyltransferase [Prevotellaceae bacterium]|nr:nicotinate-nucleotide--dimethylbenzimidazole phosphoribosyltransferase [Prevotellaceae bacterium]
MTDERLRERLQEKIDNLNKPKGSLGRLEELALQLGLTQGTLSPKLKHPCHLLFAADHGIEREGVSLSPREVTWQQMVNFTRGGGGVNVFSRQHGIDLLLVDVGVDHDLSTYPSILNRKITEHGTRNFLHEAAMTSEELERCLGVGREMADACFRRGSNVVSLGEMGIGNTSPSSLWMSLLLDIPLRECVGAGSGLSDEGVRHKLEVLTRCLERTNPTEPMDVMRELGGFEMVAAVGAMLRADELGMTVLVDGFIMTACALAAWRLKESFIKCAVFCHEGDEAGHRLMLERMGARGLLRLGLRLGEGTGALLAYPLLESAVRMLDEMNNFKDAKITKYF